MKILVVNAGSSSLKYQLIEMNDESVLAKGVCERIGQENAVLVHKGAAEVRIEKPMPTHKEAMQLVLDALVDEKYGVIGSMQEIAAVGHRVLHSGEDFKESVLISDDEVLKRIEGNVECQILSLGEPRAMHYKEVKMMAFNTVFRTNISLPLHIGLGKGASHGFGTVHRYTTPRLQNNTNASTGN